MLTISTLGFSYRKGESREGRKKLSAPQTRRSESVKRHTRLPPPVPDSDSSRGETQPKDAGPFSTSLDYFYFYFGDGFGDGGAGGEVFGETGGAGVGAGLAPSNSTSKINVELGVISGPTVRSPYARFGGTKN